ncbi:MAG: hypothetical protein [Bacteriophage sp.]|nr:MAG: hypothetical protein [Bacteriophage sp.]
MSPILQGLMVLFAAYFTVLLLGFQSKLMRDNRWQLSFFMTWLITFAQVATTWSIANNHLGMTLLVFLSGLGGSLGIVSSHFLYQWYDGRKSAGTVHPNDNKPSGDVPMAKVVGTIPHRHASN